MGRNFKECTYRSPEQDDPRETRVRKLPSLYGRVAKNVDEELHPAARLPIHSCRRSSQSSWDHYPFAGYIP